MKRKHPSEDSRMIKIAKTAEVMNKEIEPMTRIANSLSRNFSYKLSDKKAKSSLLKGAAKEALEIAERIKCTVLFFSTGSFIEVVVPTILDWKNGQQIFQVENLDIKVEEVRPGYDRDGKHMDTLIIFTVNHKKITVCCYNTTQKVKVEGSGYLEFGHKYL